VWVGWAAAICFNESIRQQFDDFRCRSDTFSLGVCNGCQLMALLGWVGSIEDCKGELFDACIHFSLVFMILLSCRVE